MKLAVYRIYKRSLRGLRALFLPYYKTQNPYWVQETNYRTINDRWDYFKPLCSQKNVLHFGCTDWPVFNPENNLHLKLSEITSELHGFDIDREGIERLRMYVDQPYYYEFSAIPDIKFDVCLIPETIEHVDNVAWFLKNVSTINAKTFVITAPNCFSRKSKNLYHKKNDSFIELVHPDHNCWYSPYTLKNVIEKYSKLSVIETLLLNEHDMVCCVCKKLESN